VTSAVKSVVHCHPPHATAFGVARADIPTCILPEVEVFLGVVPRAEYETSGGTSFAETVRPFIGKANTVVLSNHGTGSWGSSVEQAYWHTEILDAYCRIILIANDIGNVERLSKGKVEELLDLKERFGIGVDTRRTEGGRLCMNTTFGRGEDAAACARDSAADEGESDGSSTGEYRKSRKLAGDPLSAFRESGYTDRVGRDRAARKPGAGGGYA